MLPSYNWKMGQGYKTDVPDINAKRAFPMILEWSATEAVALSANGIHAAITLDTAKDVTTGITNPATPRNLTIKGTKAGASLTGDVVITGTNILDEVIEETIAIATNDSTVSGLYAFKTVTKIHVPAKVTTDDIVVIGWGDKLGLPLYMTRNTLLAAYLNGARESNLPTLVMDADEIEKNTFILGSALDGHTVELLLAGIDL